jgi:hypothetical protein
MRKIASGGWRPFNHVDLSISVQQQQQDTADSETTRQRTVVIRGNGLIN